MPIYTYRCRKCGNTFEKFKSMSSNGTENCELCSAEALRVFSPAGIIFKGSGFYTTDYKSGSSKANLNSEASKGDGKETKKDASIPQSQPVKSAGAQPSANSAPASDAGSGSGSDTCAGSGAAPDKNRDR